MEIENLLKELIQHEEVNMKKYVLFMLHKFCHLVKEIKREDEYLPLLLMKNNRITLIYKDEELEDFEYIFSDYEEILIILQKHFNEDKTLYFYFEAPSERLSREEIIEKIDESLEGNNQEMFYYYSSKLNQER